MSDNVYKITQVVGTSTESFEKAVQGAVKRARETLDDLAWFEVVEQRGRISEGDVQFQVKLDIAFKLRPG